MAEDKPIPTEGNGESAEHAETRKSIEQADWSIKANAEQLKRHAERHVDIPASDEGKPTRG